MKHRKIWMGVGIFAISTGGCFYISLFIVYFCTWIYNLFQPIPEGMDMYRDAVILSADAVPDFNNGFGISIIIALCAAALITLIWNLRTKKSPSKTIHRTITYVVENDYEDGSEKQPNTPERKNVWDKNEDDWFDAASEDYDVEDGINVEFQESEDDLD